MTLNNGNRCDVNDVLNIYHTGSNVLIGKTGTVRAPIIINNVSGDTNVYLYLRGLAAGVSATELVHGAVEHSHGTHTHEITIGNSGPIWGETSVAAQVGGSDYSDTLLYTDVPESVSIWIDGDEYTAIIGDANAKGTTMFDQTLGFEAGPYEDSDNGGSDGYILKKTFTLTGGDNLSSHVIIDYTVSNTSFGQGAFKVKWNYSDVTDNSVSFISNKDVDSSHTFTNPEPSKIVTSINLYMEAYIVSGTNTCTATMSNIKVYGQGTEATGGWGVGGATEWDTGKLDLSSLITWTAGEHYIEFKEGGGTGGTLIYQVCVNSGF